MRNLSTGHLLLIVLALIAIGFLGLWQWERTQFRAELAALHQIQSELAENRESEASFGGRSAQSPRGTPSDPTTSDPAPTASPHRTKIETIETDAGMPLSRVAALIIRDEGDRSRPYVDTSGAPTIGVGRNLRGNGLSVSELQAIAGEIDYDLLLREAHIQNGRVRIGTLALANKVFIKPLTEHDIQLLLVDDLKSAQNDAISVFGAQLWGSIAEARREAILDTVFNLGLPHFQEFVNFIGAVKRKDWKTAASELLLSDAARKSIIRYHNNARILLEGKL